MNRTRFALLVVALLVVAAGIVWAETRWWRGTRYILPYGGMKNAVEEVLTDHRMRMDSMELDFQAQIDFLQTQIDDNASDIQDNAGDITDLYDLLGNVQVWESVAEFFYASASFTPTPIVSDSIVVPADGMLLIWGNYSGEFDGDGPNVRHIAEIYVDGVAQTGWTAAHWEPGPDFFDIDSKEVSLTAALPIAAGPHTVELTYFLFTGTEDTWIVSASLHTVFLPFGQGPLAPEGGVPAVRGGARGAATPLTTRAAR